MRLTNYIRNYIIAPIVDAVSTSINAIMSDGVKACIRDNHDAFVAFDLENIRAFEQLTGVHITTKHTGKMSGVWSLSTSCKDNKRCECRANSGNPLCICFWCFSQSMHKRYKGLADVLHKNSEILMHTIIDANAWPILYSREIFRLESFGDIYTIVQVQNYVNFAGRNPHVMFALYTKNPDILESWCKFSGQQLPNNMVIVYGSPIINQSNEAAVKRFWRFIDHQFIVCNYDGILKRIWEKFGKALGVSRYDGLRDKIHLITSRMLDSVATCGARSCDSCRRCYTKSGDRDIVEILKQDAKKFSAITD